MVKAAVEFKATLLTSGLYRYSRPTVLDSGRSTPGHIRCSGKRQRRHAEHPAAAMGVPVGLRCHDRGSDVDGVCSDARVSEDIHRGRSHGIRQLRGLLAEPEAVWTGHCLTG